MVEQSISRTDLQNKQQCDHEEGRISHDQLQHHEDGKEDPTRERHPKPCQNDGIAKVGTKAPRGEALNEGQKGAAEQQANTADDGPTKGWNASL